ADSTRDDFSAAADLLHEIADLDPATPRPAEVHFLLMLRAFYNNNETLPANIQHLAIEARLLAEQAALGVRHSSDGIRPVYPYSEQVVPTDRIREADKVRRLGEDLLFASPNNWADAQARLTEAKELYTKILDDEHLRSTALAVRDEA